MQLQGALSLHDRGVISLVGAGGKTSLMYALAAELVASGRRVLTTTTTRIFMPTPDQSPCTLLSGDPEELIEKANAALRDHLHVTAASAYLPDSNKLVGLTPAELKRVDEANLFDFIIVEADGAAGRPIKACAPHEPVVPLFSDRVVMLAGLDGVGKPLTEEWVFRSAVFAEISGISPMAFVTGTDVVAMLLHDLSSIIVTDERAMKVIFLNKAETPERRRSAESIADLVERSDDAVCNRVIIGELKKKPFIHQCRLFPQRRAL